MLASGIAAGASVPPAPAAEWQTQRREAYTPGFTPDAAPPARKAPARAAIKEADIPGKYLVYGYTTASVAQKYWLDIEIDASRNVRIFNLMNKGTTVTGTYSPDKGVISISPQTLFNDPDYGDFILYEADIEKKAYYSNRDLEFRLMPDGTITTGNWGAFITSGANRGLATIHHREILYPAKATITDYSLTKTGEEAVRSYPAVFIRENDNKILIKNFYNYGADVVLTVDSAGTVNALRSLVAEGMTSSGAITKYYNYAVTDFVSESSYKLNAKGTPGTYKGKEIQLGKWAVASSTTLKSVYELLDKTVISVPDEFIPFSSALTLKGEGTAAKPFLVETAADLLSLSSAVNYSGSYTVSKKAFTGIHFLQTADIDMSGVPNFEPIGFATSSAFNGTYNGGGHRISNLNVDRRDDQYAGLFGIIETDGRVSDIVFDNPSVNSTKTHIGTAAGLSKGSISGIHVSGGNVGSGTAQVGGIAGNASGPVSGCSFRGTINAGSNSGGIVGLANGSITDCVSMAEITANRKSAIIGGVAGSVSGDTVKVSGCHFGGEISDRFGSTTIGGITGYFQRGVISGCMNTGHIYSKSVSTNTTNISGISGLLSAGTVTDCLFSGWIESPDAKTITGLVGTVTKLVGSATKPDEPKILNSLVTGLIVCPNSMTGNEFVGTTIVDYTEISGLIFDSQTSNRRSATGGMTTRQLTSGQPVGQLQSSAWDFTKEMYPSLKSLAGTDAAILAASPFFLADGDEAGAVKNDIILSPGKEGKEIEWLLLAGGKYAKTGNGLRIEDHTARMTATRACNDTLVAFLGKDLYKVAVLKIVPPEFEGDGTEQSPYLLKNRDDIIAFRNAVDYQGMRYTGVHFQLAADIDMNGDTGFIGLSSQGPDGAFNGTFDGNGHAIRNWIVDRARLENGKPAESGASQLMAGFFLYTGQEAVIKNLTIDSSCHIMAGSHVAALVSQNNGTIVNCRNNARVTGLYNEAGGLVAANNPTGIIRDSQNNGAVECGRQIAGGVAAANLGLIERCQNDGTVTNDVFSTLSPTRNLMGGTGGITGYNSGTVADCLGAGTVDGPKIVGGLVGENREKGRILTSLVTAVCLDPDDESAHGALIGSQKNTTDTLSCLYYDVQLSATTAGNHSSQPGISGLTTSRLTDGSLPEGFDSSVWSASKGRYPVLKSFEKSDEALFNAASFISFSTDGRNDSRFFMRRQAEISMPQGATARLSEGSLSLTGNTVRFTGKEGIATDTVVISSGDRIKKIPLFASGSILPKGDGSESNPWQIESAADWNSMAAFGNEYKLDLKDETFRIMNDLDFTGTAFIPANNTGTIRFQGTIDGNGKTIDNLRIKRDAASSGGTNLALVGLLGEFGQIRDLTVGANSSIEGFTNVGAFAGQNAGRIVRCTNRAAVSAANVYAGGIAGYVITGGRFEDCENFGTVVSYGGQAGGIAGGNGSDIGGLIRNSRNHGKITSEQRSAGGIIGSGRVTVESCFNDGEIRSNDIYAGGIVGYHTYDFTISNCNNEGRVTAANGMAGGIVGHMLSAGKVRHSENSGEIRSNKYYAGGIVGYCYHDRSHVENCVNRGNVSAATTHAGGIVGFLTAGSDSLSMSYIRQSVNYGSIKSTEGYCGGIAGETKAFTRLFNVANHGEIQGDIYVGGIAGGMLGKADTCLNTGSVSAVRFTAGGIVGATNTATTITASIANAANLGSVRSLSNDPASCFNIGGILGAGNIKIANSCNFADLSGYKAVGGIVGLAVRGSNTELAGLNMGTSVVDSYNAGLITPLAETGTKYCGHIAGCTDVPLLYTEFRGNFFDSQHGSKLTFPKDSVATPLLTSQFPTAMKSDAFFIPEGGVYPVLKAFADHPAMILASSAVILNPDETRHALMTPARISAPDRVEWISDDFIINGDAAEWRSLRKGETYRITARLDGHERHFHLTAGKEASGADTAIDTGRIPVRSEWHTADGRRIQAPVPGICIRTDYYDDGTSSSEKVLVRP